MKSVIYKTALFVLIGAFVFTACSSHQKPQNTPAKPAPSQDSVSANPQSLPSPQTPSPQKPTQGKTIIPEEEKLSESEETPLIENNSVGERGEAGILLEDVLISYQEARQAMDRGDLDAALALLDEAYRLFLKVEIPPDSPLLQEKNDLRLLIAQRIQEIYASRITPISENHRTIPLDENKWVTKEIQLFQTVERKSFEEAYMRSGLYRDMIKEELRKEGLPEELSWLPLIESGFKTKALSKARALGLWQFIASTGYRYGLIRDRLIDERMDPIKATQAAIKYFKELHSFFGDWTTALAAYNCGEFKVQSVIRSQRINYFDNFWDLWERLPVETARFVPRFIASLHIITNPEKYGMDLPTPYPPLEYETIMINHPLKLSALSQALGLEASELAYLNPELRFESTPDRQYLLKVPVGYGERTLQAANNLPRWIPPEATYTWHTVRKGDTLSAIARRYRTSVNAIARLNGLGRSYLIRPGQRLKIPGRGAAAGYGPDSEP